MQMNRERPTVYFQQDGAVSHHSKLTMKWFIENAISLFDLPASSLNLNIIEPIWLNLKNILRHFPYPPNTIEQLKAAVVNTWEQLLIE